MMNDIISLTGKDSVQINGITYVKEKPKRKSEILQANGTWGISGYTREAIIENFNTFIHLKGHSAVAIKQRYMKENSSLYDVYYQLANSAVYRVLRK